MSAVPGSELAMRRSVIGVNHLAYGNDGLGYGMILKGTHTLDPELVGMQKEIGFGSLRYPGGCGGTHSFCWKKNAGLDGRYRVMGVVEFLDMCEKIGADPILGLSAFRGTPEEASEYVEFLNAPADEAHPWAQKRVGRGRISPYGVIHFEYGNETYHGTHPRPGEVVQRIAPQEYASNYLAFQAAMKAVDPKIKLGVVLSGCRTAWNRRVLDMLKDRADFFIRHTYGNVPECMTDDDYLEAFVDRDRSVRQMIADQIEEIGRPDAKLAITEFNTTSRAHRTLTAALINLGTLISLAADPHVVHADYWQFVNEGFGMVRGSRGSFVKRPNAYAFELFSRYTLDVILPIEIEDRKVAMHPKVEVDSEIAAVLGRNFAEGLKFQYAIAGQDHDTGTTYVLHEDGTHELKFLDDRAMNFYHLQAHLRDLPKGDRCEWRISCLMRVEGMKGEDVNLEVTDGRGWSQTHSAKGLPSVGCPDWIEVSAVYHPLKDNPGSLIIRFRRDGGGGAGCAFVRDLRVEAVVCEPLQESAVAGQLSVAKDGTSAALILMNRSLSPHEVAFDVQSISGFKGLGGRVSAETLSGPSAYATNEEVGENVKLVPFSAVAEGRVIRAALPPHSATGLRIEAPIVPKPTNCLPSRAD